MRILIIGKNSYIGSSFRSWIEQKYPNEVVASISVRDAKWKETSFAHYDVVLYTAGIAHIKESVANSNLYYTVNRDLAVATAKKAKEEGVKQFIYLSSMSVYGMVQGTITKQTIPNPTTHYGKSKLAAEQALTKLIDDSFDVVCVRPPMVYGKGCTGNFARLAQLAESVAIFPKVNNKRSMIYIDGLNQFLWEVIGRGITGVCCPQNNQYICTTELMKELYIAKGKRYLLVPGCESLCTLGAKKIGTLSKLFGDLVYDQELSDIGVDYQRLSFTETIQRSL